MYSSSVVKRIFRHQIYRTAEIAISFIVDITEISMGDFCKTELYDIVHVLCCSCVL